MIVSSRSFGNRDDRVDAVAQRFEPALGLQLPLLALELERLGDDGDGQRAELAREAGDDRRRAGAGAAAEAGRDEDHVGAVERLDDLLGVLERRRAADVRVGAGAEPLGQLRADLQLDRRGVGLQRLQVGVGDDELDAVEPGAHHPVDGVAAAAADADHLDAGAGAAPLRRAAAAGAASSRSSTHSSGLLSSAIGRSVSRPARGRPRRPFRRTP